MANATFEQAIQENLGNMLFQLLQAQYTNKMLSEQNVELQVQLDKLMPKEKPVPKPKLVK